MRSTSSTAQSLLALFGCACLTVHNVDGLGMKTASYQDALCTDTEILSESTFFGATNFNADSEIVYEPFNECYINLGGTGTITTCDPTTGEITTESYSDAECTDLLVSTPTPTTCTEIVGQTCGPGLACATITTCVDEDPVKIERQTFNIVGEQYSDQNCTDPTGSTEIISGDVFGYDEGCASFGASIGDFLAECGEDATRSQQLDSFDGTCSGDVVGEFLAYPVDVETEQLCSPTAVEGSYYTFTECTTDSPTVGEGSTVAPITPAPLASIPDSSSTTTSDTPVTATSAETLAPATQSDADSSTPSPESGNRGITETMAPTSGGRDTTDSDTPSPAAVVDSGNTPSPVGAVDSGTSAPTTTEGTQGNGATTARMGAGAAIVTCVVALLAAGEFGA